MSSVAVCAVASASVWDRVARVKSANRSRSVTVRPTRPPVRMRRATPIDEGDQAGVDLVGGVAGQAHGALRAHRLPAPPALHRARVLVVGQGVQVPSRGGAEHRHQRARRQPRHLADRGQAVGVQLGRRLGPDAPEPLDGQRVEERGLAVGRHHQQAVGLGARARHLGEELGAGHADGDGEAHLVADGAAEAGGDLGRGARRAPQTAHVEERLVDRDALDQRGGALEHREHGPARLGVRRHAGLDHHGVGAQQAGLAAAHGAAHAARPGLVAGGHDHPAPDDDRAPAEAGVVALLDRREEGVEVGVQDRGLAGGRSHTNRCSLDWPAGRNGRAAADARP